MNKFKQICKANKFFLPIIITALFLLAICIDSTIAWFASSQYANRSIPLSGAVSVVAVGGSENSYPDTIGTGSMQATLPYNVLIPNGNVGLRANARIKHSTSTALIKATVMVDIYGLRENLSAHELEILSAIEAVIPSTWAKVENHWYYIGDNARQTVLGATELKTVNSSSGDVNVDFINTDFIFPKKINEVASDAEVVISVIFEAIQSFVPTSQGLPDVATINNAQRLFNESSLDRINKRGMILHLDGLNNTGSGHSTTTNIWKDLSTSNDDATLHFTTNEANGWTSKGLRNSSTNYAETSGVVNYGNYDASGNHDFTISLTFTLNTYSNFVGLISNVAKSGSVGVSGFNLMCGDYGNNSYYSNSSSSCDYLVSATATASAGYSYSTTGKVFHLTFAFDNTNSKIYIYSNGNLRAQISGQIVNSQNAKLQLFRYFHGDESLIGDTTIYNVVINDTVLSASEVWNNFCYSMSRYYIANDVEAITTTGMEFTYSAGSSGGSYTLTNGKALTGKVYLPAFVYTEENGMLPVTKIGDNAFYKNFNVTDIEIGDGFVSIGGNVFHNCSKITSFYIPASIIEIGYGALMTGSYDLEEYSIDPNNANFCVQDGVLYSKDMKTLVSYPSGKKDQIFNIPDVTNIIQSTALVSMRFTEEVKIPKYLTNIEIYNLVYCNKLRRISVDSANPKYTDVDGILYSKDMSTLVVYPNRHPVTDVIIDSRVTLIAYAAFTGSKADITSLVIPETVKGTAGNPAICEDNRKLATVTVASQNILDLMCIDGSTNYDKTRVLTYCNTAYIKTGLNTSKATFITTYFTKQSSSDKTGYDKWTRN